MASEPLDSVLCIGDLSVLFNLLVHCIRSCAESIVYFRIIPYLSSMLSVCLSCNVGNFMFLDPLAVGFCYSSLAMHACRYDLLY